MASFTETVRFCFPQPSGPHDDELPMNQSNGNGSGASRRERANETISGRQEPEDLGKGAAKISVGAILRSYALDWILVAAMW